MIQIIIRLQITINANEKKKIKINIGNDCSFLSQIQHYF